MIAATAAASLIMAVASGCDDNSPVAAPTSTLPAPSESDAEATPTIPEYTTDLDLDDEEKKAVEGALVAFEGYIKTINAVFSSGGTDLDGADEFARDGSLESLESDAKDMRTKNRYMAGKYSAYDVRIESVDISDEDSASKVGILFCTKDSEWSVVGRGEELPSMDPKGITMQHVANNEDGRWKIANQYLRSKTCE